MEIFKEFRFEAAHRLEGLPEGHPCGRLHGHSYRVRVFVRGLPDPKSGWVRDFADIKAAAAPVFARLDHAFLNEVEGLGPSTCEHIAVYLWRQLRPRISGLSAVEVWETATAGAIYRGEDEPGAVG
ncbi:MAG: 6-carboxytetrahydropterin synthase QueD [Phycisphaeraceae bacterium]|nr:MAG: 6-carboxytetrahydropterin synthase QueD [Phycisphaeraceae bacterium]